MVKRVLVGRLVVTLPEKLRVMMLLEPTTVPNEVTEMLVVLVLMK